MTIHELAANWIEHADVFPVPEIDEDTAAKYISWMDPDTDLPEDLNPHDFMVEWNDVVNEQLVPVWESIVNLMDDEIRESVHADFAPCTESVFLEEYMKRHFEKYGEKFTW